MTKRNERDEAREKLEIFLKNPGRFCVCVLGKRGTGKHYNIDNVFTIIKNVSDEGQCLTDIVFIESVDFPTEGDKLDELFQENKHKTLVIEDIEDLEENQQRLLFKALETQDGTFGIKNKVRIRVVFTSSKDMEELRNNEERNILGFFWDRISQLIVKFPAYSEFSSSSSGIILQDFKETWAKMKFDQIKDYEHLAKLPKNATLEKFLEDDSHKFEGGFRDLDKLACMYFNYRILYYKVDKAIDEQIEKLIVNRIKEDFFGLSQLQHHSSSSLDTFYIKPGYSMEDLLGQFKIQVRNWAIKQYGGVGKAEKKLDLGAGTLKNYKKGKVTQSQKISDKS